MLYVDSDLEGLAWNLPLLLIVGAGLLGLAAVLVEPIRSEPSGLQRILGLAAVVVAAGLTLYCVAPRYSRVDVPDATSPIVGIPMLVAALLYLVATVLRWRSGQTSLVVAVLGAVATLPILGVVVMIDEDSPRALPAYMVIATMLFAAATVVPERSIGRVLAVRLGTVLSLLALNRISDRFWPMGDHGIADLMLIALAALAVGTSIVAARAARAVDAG
jgi:hypothetical protein